jgi:predicted alpha/beta superfamily hydrolase
VPPTIVVGVWCTALRVREYLPQRPFTTPIGQQQLAALGGDFADGPLSDAYLRFLTGELKLFIDANFRTQPQRETTTIMGSSMGGLISLYALCEYPDLFAGAGCVSTHWPIGDGLVIDALADMLPPPGRHKIYFDFGTGTLDALYEPYQQKADTIMAAAGYTHGQDWLTRKFPGAEHSERSWRERVHIPLEFLLGTL